MKGNGCRKARHQLLDLAVIENRAVAFVPQESARPSGFKRSERVRRNVNDASRDTESVRDGFVDLVPRQHFIRRDVVALTDTARVSEERHETLREILRVRHRPQARPVSMDDDGAPSK